jgi:hypothetical protein
MMGIEAISIVENPAIEENFLALKSDEIKLAEVNKEKRILMGALLVPNKPIFRRNGEDEYYIYFSKDTVAKASQLYLKNGNQNNSTLEHKHELNGLTLVESWIVEDEKYDKSRKYGLDVPVGTWMGAVKVNNDEIWDEYVKSGKVKGFSIEGYFADKVEATKVDKEEEEAKELLAKIESIVKGEKVELNSVQDLKELISEADRIIGLQEDGFKWSEKAERELKEVKKRISDAEGITRGAIRQAENLKKESDKIFNNLKVSAKELGVNINSIKEYNIANKLISQLINNQKSLNDFNSRMKKLI